MTDALAIDTETALIAPGLLAPPLACMTYSDGKNSGIIHHTHATEAFREILADGATIIGQNIPYDLAVIMTHAHDLTADIFALYHHDRIRDTKIRETLLMIKEGGKLRRNLTSLKALAKKYLHLDLAKGEETGRTTFGNLIGVPLDRWPKASVSYAIQDALVTYRVDRSQGSGPVSPDESLQVKADFALHLMAVEGIRSEGSEVTKLRIETEGMIQSFESELLGAGILKPKKITKKLQAEIEARREAGEEVEDIYSKDTKAIQWRVAKGYELQGLETPRTPPSKRFPDGQIAADKEALTDCGDPLLANLVIRNGYSKTADFLTLLEKATDVPYNPRWNCLVSSGRTSCGSDKGADDGRDDVGNLQNQPRKAGVRECFVPPAGQVYVTCDFDTAELRALAQVTYSWFGESEMRECFVRGGEPHVDLAASMLGIDKAEAYRRYKSKDKAEKSAFKETRQFAKVPNFGFPGGLGAQKFVSYAKTNTNGKMLITEERARELRDLWFITWPEMRRYFEVISEITSATGPRALEQFGSGRVRGQVGFCDGANTMFQGLIADTAKDALWEVTWRCYTDPSSALFGCRPCLFIHDEIILHAPENRAASAALELEKIMVTTAEKWMPDVPQRATAHLMRRWYKCAEEKFGPDGDLVPWEMWHWGERTGDGADTLCGFFRTFEDLTLDPSVVTCPMCAETIKQSAR